MVSMAEPPQPLISVFYPRATTFSFKYSSFILTRLSGPHSRHTATTCCYSENLVAPGIEHGISEFAPRNSDHQTTKPVNWTEMPLIQLFQSCTPNSLRTYFYMGVRGSVVVKALCYTPEGRGFETR
jgi:hypothetical protein